MTMTLNNIPKKQVPHLLALFNNLSYITPGAVEVTDEAEVFYANFKESIQEFNAYVRGEIKLRSVEDILNDN